MTQGRDFQTLMAYRFLAFTLFIGCLFALLPGMTRVAAQTPPITIRADVMVGHLPVRDTYEATGRVIGAYERGAILELTGRQPDPVGGAMWVYARPLQGSNLTGWVWSAYLRPSGSASLSDLPVTDAVGIYATGETTAIFTESQTAGEITLPGVTRSAVNMRSGPGARFDIVAVLSAQQPIVFNGRNQSGTWLRAQAQGVEGWLSYTFVVVEGDINSLPILGAVTVTSSTPIPTPSAPVVPGPAGVVPEITPNVREIYLRGLDLGNTPGVFSKVGDSITATTLFLSQISSGTLILGEYEYLRPVIEFFSQIPARDHYSFANSSLAARGGWTSDDVLNPARAASGLCRRGETPLVCEYRTNRPSIALIMFGTNDVGQMNANTYRANMELIIQISIDMGVIPVISTIPDRPDSTAAPRVFEFNAILAELAAIYDIPLWDYWLAMQDLPNRGLSGDRVHPSYDYATPQTANFTPEGLRYGFNMRNLTALMVLDAIWRGAMY